MEPNETGKGFEFIDEIKGGAVPRNIFQQLRKGFERRFSGVLADILLLM